MSVSSANGVSPEQHKLSTSPPNEASPLERKTLASLPSESSLGREKTIDSRNEALRRRRNMSIGSSRWARQLERKTPIRSSGLPCRGSLSSLHHPDAKPISIGINIESQHLVRKIYWQHNITQVPMYYIKWILAQLLALYSVIFWRTPDNDDEVVRIFEETSLVAILRRDHEAEMTEREAFRTLKGCTTGDIQPLLETRHYYIDVKRCNLELIVRERVTTTTRNGKPVDGESTLFKSLSARYTKTRRRVGCEDGVTVKKGTEHGKWTNHIVSFVVNGKAIYEREQMFTFLHQYLVFSNHTKSHVMGNGLTYRILSDERITNTLTESTWSTTALHYGLLNGTQGPLTYLRTSANAWMGIGSLPTRDSILMESENVSALGAGHSNEQRWAELELPFADFLLGARLALTRAMEKNAIPPDIYEAIFLSCIVHATDHVMHDRVFWGKVFSFNPNGKPGKWYDHYESTVWRYMWATPTLNPIWNNKIRSIRKPFYRQLYKGIKEIDTFKVADEITASIMY